MPAALAASRIVTPGPASKDAPEFSVTFGIACLQPAAQKELLIRSPAS
jgi:hypothetical protein